MDTDFAFSLMFTLNQEGGFSDDPHDPGGATMDGITLAEFQAWYGHDKTVADLKAITGEQLGQIYMESYWVQVRGGDLPAGVDLSVFDMGVNAGPKRSIELLQAVLGVTADGVLGPISLAALASVTANGVTLSVLKKLAKAQGDFYRSLSTYKYFGKGWIARANARYNAAAGLLVGPHVGKAM